MLSQVTVTNYFILATSRIRTVAVYLLVSTVLLSFIDLVRFANFYFFYYTIAGAIITYCALFFLARYAHEIIFVSHPFILFVFTTYLYAILHSKSVVEGLGAPTTSITIATIYELDAAIALGVLRLTEACFGAHTSTQTVSRNGIGYAKYFLIVIGLIATLAYNLHIAGSATWYILSLLLFVGLAYYISERGYLYPLSWVVVSSIFMGLSISLITSNRSAFLVFIVFLCFAHIQYAKSALRWSTVLAAYFGASFMSVFSDIMLSSRYLRFSGIFDFMFEVSRKLFSSDTLLAIIAPFLFVHPASTEWANSIDPDNLFRSRFFDGNISLLQRLSHLPQMDIVVANITDTNFRMGEVLNLVFSVLPSFGQEKDLILSDRITWELGLRAVNNYGRPMITAAGEQFYIGGYWGVFLIGAVSLFCFLASLNVLRKSIGNDNVFGLVFCTTTIYSIYTTTALSVLQEALRTNVFLFVTIYMLKLFVSRKTSH